MASHHGYARPLFPPVVDDSSGAVAVTFADQDLAASLTANVHDTFVVNKAGTAARFNHPRALAILPDGFIYVGEDGAVRLLDPSNQEVVTVAGAGSTTTPRSRAS